MTLTKEDIKDLKDWVKCVKQSVKCVKAGDSKESLEDLKADVSLTLGVIRRIMSN